jgi:acetamidase/formamidase
MFTFVPVRRVRGGLRGLIPAGPRHQARIPIDPFPGTMGVALDTTEPVNSVPPNAGAGNLDIQDFTVGSRLWVPVMVPGASFYTGRSPLRHGRPRGRAHSDRGLAARHGAPNRPQKGDPAIPGGRGTLEGPFGETRELWLPIGLDPDLDQAMKKRDAQRDRVLNGELGMSRADALAFASADIDFAVTQVVDRTKGVHGRIVKDHLVPV